MQRKKIPQNEIVEIGRLFVSEKYSTKQIAEMTKKTIYMIDKALESYFAYAKENPSELTFIPASWHEFVRKFSHSLQRVEEKIPDYVARSLDKIRASVGDYGIDLKGSYINALKYRLIKIYEKKGIGGVDELTNFIIDTNVKLCKLRQNKSKEKTRKILSWYLQHVKKKAREIISR